MKRYENIFYCNKLLGYMLVNGSWFVLIVRVLKTYMRYSCIKLEQQQSHNFSLEKEMVTYDLNVAPFYIH